MINTAPGPSTEAPTDLAEKCKPEECSLPYCFCSKDGTAPPNDLNPEDVMFILLFKVFL